MLFVISKCNINQCNISLVTFACLLYDSIGIHKKIGQCDSKESNWIALRTFTAFLKALSWALLHIAVIKIVWKQISNNKIG